MSSSLVRLEIENNIAVVTLDRPERLNAFNEAMFSDLENVTFELKQKPPRVAILTGAGDKAFGAGFDVNPDNPLNHLTEATSDDDETPAAKIVHRVRRAIDGFVSLPVPLIVALNGLAYGGAAETAVRCDLRVMDPRAIICFSETRLGLMPDFGGGPSLVRLIGASRAADLILTTREVGAEEALSIGLINRISQPGQALDEAKAMAKKIVQNGPLATRYALSVIRHCQDLTLSDALAFEAKKAISLIATGESIHGVTAFLEKRKPDFSDID
ncbi:MAG: enoyl-CoA hydratase/isomerase family protein [Deltaproteobacteria bacterium]|nr:enoyl-CoA hydratase/isomerase family protein [Deltaproteobacteria bacterium]